MGDLAFLEGQRLLITGGAGFIGSALVRRVVLRSAAHVTNVDALTYAGNLDSLRDVDRASNYRFEPADIRNRAVLRELLDHARPTSIVHLAAESHVDRSIDGPGDFVETNLIGTFNLLEETRRYWQKLPDSKRATFRFHHVSTDEVYGTLPAEGYFTEATAYAPSSPYSATKAGSDHLVRAWGRTYGLPILITNCSNNYGPFQFPEKLIPLVTLNAIEEKPLPVYGRGENVRDWLHVDDHVSAILRVLEAGVLDHTYVIGGAAERRNIDVVTAIADIVDELVPSKRCDRRRELIDFVPDRPGHDQRYAIDSSKIRDELGWMPSRTFEERLEETVRWYLENRWWWERVRSGAYRGERLGLQVQEQE